MASPAAGEAATALRLLQSAFHSGQGRRGVLLSWLPTTRLQTTTGRRDRCPRVPPSGSVAGFRAGRAAEHPGQARAHSAARSGAAFRRGRFDRLTRARPNRLLRSERADRAVTRWPRARGPTHLTLPEQRNGRRLPCHAVTPQRVTQIAPRQLGLETALPSWRRRLFRHRRPALLHKTGQGTGIGFRFRLGATGSRFRCPRRAVVVEALPEQRDFTFQTVVRRAQRLVVEFDERQPPAEVGDHLSQRRCQRNGGSSTCSVTVISRAAIYAARARHSAKAAERLCL